MQSSQRKISKKDLKEDQLITFYYKARAFLDKHGKLTTGVTIGLVALIIISVLVVKSRVQANIVAGGELFKAQMSYGQGNYRGAIGNLYNLIDTYPGTDNAAEAYLHLAKSYYRIAEYDSALYFADKFLGKKSGDPILSGTALNVKAACFEIQEDFSRAAESYLEGADKFPDSFAAPRFLYDAARCLHMAGQDEKARQTIDRLFREYAESLVLNEANKLLALAGGEPKKLQAGAWF